MSYYVLLSFRHRESSIRKLGQDTLRDLVPEQAGADPDDLREVLGKCIALARSEDLGTPIKNRLSRKEHCWVACIRRAREDLDIEGFALMSPDAELFQQVQKCFAEVPKRKGVALWDFSEPDRTAQALRTTATASPSKELQRAEYFEALRKFYAQTCAEVLGLQTPPADSMDRWLLEQLAQPRGSGDPLLPHPRLAESSNVMRRELLAEVPMRCHSRVTGKLAEEQLVRYLGRAQDWLTKLKEPSDSALSREVLALAEWLKENEGSWKGGRRSAEDCIFRRKLDGLVVESAVEVGLSVRFRVAVEDKAVEILKKVSDEAERIAKELVSLQESIFPTSDAPLLCEDSAFGDDERVALEESAAQSGCFLGVYVFVDVCIGLPIWRTCTADLSLRDARCWSHTKKAECKLLKAKATGSFRCLASARREEGQLEHQGGRHQVVPEQSRLEYAQAPAHCQDVLPVSSMHLQKLRSLYEAEVGVGGDFQAGPKYPRKGVGESTQGLSTVMEKKEFGLACLLAFSNLVAVHAWRVSNPEVPGSMYVLGCGPSQVCQSKGRFSCALKSDSDLADGAAKVAKRLLAKAQAFNSSTWATRGAIQFRKLTVALKDLNVYAQVLLEPGDMPRFRHEMQAAKASVSQAALTINEAWNRNGLLRSHSKTVSLRSFVEYIDEISKKNAMFDPSQIKDFLIRCFPGIPTEVLAETTKDVEAALSSEPACQPSPMTAGCSRALLHAYWGKVLSGAQQFLEGAEAEQAEDDEGAEGSEGSGLLQVENAFAGLFFLSFMVFFHMMIPFMIISLPIWLPGQLVLAAFFGVLKLMGIGP
ncbi:pcif1 [Symbiodinium sp. CCMP2592]|nr:pcif1 [Symbiodinium sp. CCMP2592]